MKLSFIFELLLIFILVAFAASAVVTDSKLPSLTLRKNAFRKTTNVKQQKMRENKNQTLVLGQNQTSQIQNQPNRFCSCIKFMCNCCRNFNLQLLNLKGPGCASLQYLQGDQLAISLSFNDRVLTNTTIKGRKPPPICMPLPGGISKFCGRVYNIGRQGDEFNACLGLELRALNEVEAAIRVSCFRFGSKGLRLEAPQPLPPIDEDNDEEDDEDDDDDDDEDDDDDDDFGFDGDDDDDDVDFTVFDDDFIGEYFQEEDDSLNNNKVKSTTTTTTTTTIKPTFRRISRKPTLKRKVMKHTIKTSTVTKTKVDLPQRKSPTTQKTTKKPYVPTNFDFIQNNTVTTTVPETIQDTNVTDNNTTNLIANEKIVNIQDSLQSNKINIKDLDEKIISTTYSSTVEDTTNENIESLRQNQ